MKFKRGDRVRDKSLKVRGTVLYYINTSIVVISTKFTGDLWYKDDALRRIGKTIKEL